MLLQCKNNKSLFLFEKGFNFLLISLCPQGDSNSHTREGTTPSRWRVYQFHHVDF